MKYKIYTLIFSFFICTTSIVAQIEDDESNQNNDSYIEFDAESLGIDNPGDEVKDEIKDELNENQVYKSRSGNEPLVYPGSAAREQLKRLGGGVPKNSQERKQLILRILTIEKRAKETTRAVLTVLSRKSVSELNRPEFAFYVKLFRVLYGIEPQDYNDKFSQLIDYLTLMIDNHPPVWHDLLTEFPNDHKEKCKSGDKKYDAYVKNKEIYLCEAWIFYPADCRLMTMIHEDSHVAGTGDKYDIYNTPIDERLDSASHMALLVHSIWLQKLYKPAWKFCDSF